MKKLNHPEMKFGPESLQHATVSPDTVSQTSTYICSKIQNSGSSLTDPRLRRKEPFTFVELLSICSKFFHTAFAGLIIDTINGTICKLKSTR